MEAVEVETLFVLVIGKVLMMTAAAATFSLS